jgi:hypothetical protein
VFDWTESQNDKYKNAAAKLSSRIRSYASHGLQDDRNQNLRTTGLALPVGDFFSSLETDLAMCPITERFVT